jgi:hypothetical protein
VQSVNTSRIDVNSTVGLDTLITLLNLAHIKFVLF